jgi:folate-dependent phosphoribosylglycinamide formyltransferase PurN
MSANSGPGGTKRLKIAVGVSGGGRSLANLIECQSAGNFEVALVFSSASHLKANDVARERGIPVLVLDFSGERKLSSADQLYSACGAAGIDLIVLAGFLKLLPVAKEWSGRIINIHPALLPKFGGRGMYGDRVHQAVLAAGEKTSGASVHFVTANYDEGSLIARATVEVLASDTVSDLATRVFAAEKALLPAVIGKLAAGDLPDSQPRDYKWVDGELL